MCDVVRNTVFINCQKLPSKVVTRTNFTDLHESISKNSDLLLRQVQLLNPNVLIFANTFHLYRPILGLTEQTPIRKGTVDYIVNNEKLYIDAYHPSQRTIKRKDYINDIVELIQLWQNNLLL